MTGTVLMRSKGYLLSFQKASNVCLIIVLAFGACISVKKHQEIPFKVLKGYFVRNDFAVHVYADTVINSKSTFEGLFGYATIMGRKSDPINFERETILAIMPAVTDLDTQIHLNSIEQINGEIVVHYKINSGQKQTFDSRPLLLISLPEKYSEPIRFFGNYPATPSGEK
jgi:hypothetical protein